MSTRCVGMTRAGVQCSGIAVRSQWCYSHDPGRAEERSRNSRKGGKRGGRGRPSLSGELEELRLSLADLTADVLSGDVLTGRASVACQIINTRLRLLEVERKMIEQTDFEERLTKLEGQLDGTPPPTPLRGYR